MPVQIKSTDRRAKYTRHAGKGSPPKGSPKGSPRFVDEFIPKIAALFEI